MGSYFENLGSGAGKSGAAKVILGGHVKHTFAFSIPSSTDLVIKPFYSRCCTFCKEKAAGINLQCDDIFLCRDALLQLVQPVLY